MKPGEQKGLLAIWADIDEDYRLTFEKWHNCEHMAERVTIPGFYVGRRYRAMDVDGHYFMFYEAANSKVFGDQAYLRSVNNPTPRTREAISRFKNPVRAIFGLLASAGESPLVDAPYLFVMRFNSRSRGAVQWYGDTYLPKLCTLPGVYRARLYEVDPEISGIETTERTIYFPRQGNQRFLVMVELVSSELPKNHAWQELSKGIERGHAMFRELEDVEERVYWLDFAMYAPEVHSR